MRTPDPNELDHRLLPAGTLCSPLSDVARIFPHLGVKGDRPHRIINHFRQRGVGLYYALTTLAGIQDRFHPEPAIPGERDHLVLRGAP